MLALPGMVVVFVPDEKINLGDVTVHGWTIS